MMQRRHGHRRCRPDFLKLGLGRSWQRHILATTLLGLGNQVALASASHLGPWRNMIRLSSTSSSYSPSYNIRRADALLFYNPAKPSGIEARTHANARTNRRAQERIFMVIGASRTGSRQRGPIDIHRAWGRRRSKVGALQGAARLRGGMGRSGNLSDAPSHAPSQRRGRRSVDQQTCSSHPLPFQLTI